MPKVPLAGQVLGTWVSQTLELGTYWVEDTLASKGVRASLSSAPFLDLQVKVSPGSFSPSGRRFLMRVLDSYGDDYRASQFTIVLEVSMESLGGWVSGEPRTQPSPASCFPTRTRAARAQMPPPQAILRTSLQRKRGCPRPEGHLHSQNPAAQPPARGPVGAKGGERPGKDAEQELC